VGPGLAKAFGSAVQQRGRPHGVTDWAQVVVMKTVRGVAMRLRDEGIATYGIKT
jgi:hypothetical protein